MAQALPGLSGIERTALAIYGLVLRILQPLLRRKLRRRAQQEPEYGLNVAQRFGYYVDDAPPGGLVWLHAVSLGETRAAALLLPALREAIPGMRLLLTHGTATGLAQGRALLQPGDEQAWLPWDTAQATRQFLVHFKPRIGLLMETEVWPGLVEACRHARVPLCLLNARMSEKSWRQASRWSWLSGPAYRGLSLVLALAVGLFSLRVRAIFFAMITLAVATAFMTLASQLSDFTGGEDGLSFKLPELLLPSTEFSEEPFLGVSLDGRLLCYYLLFVIAVGMVLSLLRIVNSPFGRVLQAFRENEFRAEAIGYRVVVYRTLSSVLSALYACVAGAMLALWLRYNGPDTSLSFEIMMDVLLIVVIGGMGTIYGAAIGSVLFLLAQSYLQDLLRLASEATTSLPLLSALLSPDRWLLWLGLLFVLSVYYFPTGVVGRLRTRAALRALASSKQA